MAWISNYIPQYSMICNYLSTFTSFLILAHRSSYIYIYIYIFRCFPCYCLQWNCYKNCSGPFSTCFSTQIWLQRVCLRTILVMWSSCSSLFITGACFVNNFPIIINSLHAKFSAETYHECTVIPMYLQFLAFLHTDMTQVVEILPHVRQGPTYR